MNDDLIFARWCEVHPEKVHSDYYYEDAVEDGMFDDFLDEYFSPITVDEQCRKILSKRVDDVDTFLQSHSMNEVKDALDSYYYFSPKKLMSDFDHVRSIIEPSLFEGQNYFRIGASPKANEKFVKYFPFDPDRFQKLLNLIKLNGYTSMGYALSTEPDSPIVFIFGEKEYVEAEKKRWEITI